MAEMDAVMLCSDQSSLFPLDYDDFLRCYEFWQREIHELFDFIVKKRIIDFINDSTRIITYEYLIDLDKLQNSEIHLRLDEFRKQYEKKKQILLMFEEYLYYLLPELAEIFRRTKDFDFILSLPQLEHIKTYCLFEE